MKNMHKRNILFALMCIFGAIAIVILGMCMHMVATAHFLYLIPTGVSAYASYLYIRLIIYFIQKKDLTGERSTWI
jgi:hypothetical protein